MSEDEALVVTKRSRALITWIGTGVVTLITLSAGGAVWAYRIEDNLSEATEALTRLATEMERRPTAAEIDMRWATFGALNPKIVLPPIHVGQ